MKPGHALLLIAVVAALFGWSITGGFHFDDFAVLSDPAVQDPLGWWTVWSPLQTRPLTWFSFWLNYAISGDSPWSWHALNVLLHAIATVLLYRFLTRFVPGHAALVAALLFAVHPIQVEPVVYVYSRAIILATIFSLLCAEAWLEGEWARAAGFYIFALLGKEECVALPLVLLLLRRAWIPFSVLVALSLAAGARIFAAIYLLGIRGAGPGSVVTPGDYVITQGTVILRYLRLLVIPWGFSGDPYVPIASAGLGAGAWLLLIASALVIGRRVRGGLWFVAGLILLLPSSSFLPAEDLSADRRLYLPITAFCAFAAQWLTNSRRQRAFAAIFLFGLVLVAAGRIAVWKDTRRVWAEAAERNPQKLRPSIMLARLTDNHTEALRILEEAAQRHPEDHRGWFEYGLRALRAGQNERAVLALERAQRTGPPDERARLQLGLAYLQLDRVADAAAQIRQAMEIQPCLPGLREAATRVGVEMAPVTCSEADAVVEGSKELLR